MIGRVATPDDSAETARLRHLIEVGRALMTDLDPDAILGRLLTAARELTAARYAALGVLDEQRVELARFLTEGVAPDAHRAIGSLPRGNGVLGLLIDDPRPLRLRDVGEHPDSYGFPTGHPPMRSFLGVPILIRGQAWGNLYLTEKEGGDSFTDADEEAVVVLAAWAATAIDNARLFQTGEQRRRELERAVRGLRATRDVAIAIGSETNLARVLSLIAKRGRALVEADTLLVLLREGAELALVASAGSAAAIEGIRLPLEGSTSGGVLREGRARRIVDVAANLQVPPASLGVHKARTALLVPMFHRGQPVGVLAAFDRQGEDPAFSDDDEQLLRMFSASAANAVMLARTAEEDRVRSSLAAADSERRRWARELHDETLQALGGLRVLLSSALRAGNPARAMEAIQVAIEQVEQEIANLRAIISDLRPAALDELGLAPALEALLDRHRRGGLDVRAEVDVTAAAGERRLHPELETTVYRVLQESLTNVVKHAQARSVRVAVRINDNDVTLEVQDDGAGFDPEAATAGFGLVGMRERIRLAGGELQIESARGGTLIHADLPVRWRGMRSSPSPYEHAA
jgi:signal transduction histidine kinase